jgi:hypothetical protein
MADRDTLQGFVIETYSLIMLLVEKPGATRKQIRYKAKSTELFVIIAAMIFFLAICAVAVWAFARQYRREHPKDGARRNDRQ